MNRRDFIRNLVLASVSAVVIPGLEPLLIPCGEAAELPSFSFVHITDLHLDVEGTNTWQYREKSVPLFIDTLRQIGRLPKLSFAIFGGDQVQAGPRDRDSLHVFQEWVKQLDVPSYMLLGNMEVSKLSGISRLGKEDYLLAWSGQGIGPGRTSWTVDPVKGVRVIGFDVTVDDMPHGEATPERLDWLARELDAARNKKLVIVATHQLLQPTCALDEEPEGAIWMVRNHREVRILLEDHPNVRLVLSGHHHAARVETVGRITYVASPAVVSYPCAFRLFTVVPGRIEVRSLGIDDRALVARARDILAADPYARLYDPAYPQSVITYSNGLTDQDRDTTIQL
jgi:Icc protein